MPASRVPDYPVNLQNPDGSTNLTWWRFWKAIAAQFSGVDAPVTPAPPPAPPQAARPDPAAAAALDLAAIAASRIRSVPAAAPAIGGVNVQTGNYTAVASDSGQLISFNDASPCTLTLPATPPFPQWCIFVQNTGNGILSINPNGLNLDGLTPNQPLQKTEGWYIATDGANYFSDRGGGPGAPVKIETGNYTAVPADNAKLISFNDASPCTLTLPAASPGGRWFCFVENIGAGVLTISPNGLNLDGSASSITLAKNQGCYIATDALNYFTMRGIGGAPGGANTQVQYDNNGVFGGITGATTDGTNLSVTTQALTDNTTKAASDAFVQAVVANAIAGINPAIAVQAATTGAADTSGLTYFNGVSGIGATFTGTAATALTIDGYTFTALGQRLLVKNDTQSPSGAFNGIYYVTQLQTALLPPILTRALDYDQPSDMNNTGAIPVINGTANASTSWVLTSQVATVGTTPLTYAQFSINPASIVTAVTGVAPVASSGGTTPAISVAAATSAALGVVKPDGTVITVSAGAITVPAATSAALGVVKPDGTVITVAAGAITVPKASSSTFGVCEVDGTTITASGGVLSATGGGTSGGLTLIASSIFSGAAASVTFSAIPGTYNHLMLVAMARTDRAAVSDGVLVTINGDVTGGDYAGNQILASGSSISVTGNTGNYLCGVAAASAGAGQPGSFTVDIPRYAGTVLEKILNTRGSFDSGATLNGVQININSTIWGSTAAITSIELTPQHGVNFIAGSAFYLYGY